MSDVFVSYTRKDSDVVLPFAASLKEVGLEVWIDSDGDTIGKQFRDEIGRAMSESRVIVCFYGPHGQGSVQEEEIAFALSLASKKKVTFVPVVLPKTPDDLKPQQLEGIYGYLDLRSADVGDAVASIYKIVTGRALPRKAPPASDDRATQIDPREAEDSERAVREVIEKLRSGTVAFFLGSRFSPATGVPPSFEVASRVLKKLEPSGASAAERSAEELLFLDALAPYYSAAWSPDELEALVNSAIQDVDKGPGAFGTLVRIVAAVMKSAKTRDEYSRTAPPLLMTTNVSSLLERELLEAGVAFTRFVVLEHGMGIQVNEYKSVLKGGDGELVITSGNSSESVPPVADPNHLPKLRKVVRDMGLRRFARGPKSGAKGWEDLNNFHMADFTPPFVYKYHGSNDVRGSCAVSSDHYIHLSRSGGLPSEIEEYVENEMGVFLGYSPLDPDFRQLYSAVVRRGIDLNPDPQRYLVQASPNPGFDDPLRVRLEAPHWASMKKHVNVKLSLGLIEMRSATFLKSVAEGLGA